MSEESLTYTEADLREFRRLVLMTESRNQMSRINARFEMPKFIEKHGKEKCDAMFEILKKEV
jgi:hypothetical protein